MTLKRSALCLLVLATVWLALVTARFAIRVDTGLNAEYFAREAPAGQPAFTGLDANISTDQVTHRWHGVPPDVFAVRWFGYVTVRRAGTYTLALTSDDGSRLSIDGELVIDNGGRHGPITMTARRDLTAGQHAVLLEYSQLGGDFAIDWSWARNGSAPGPIPTWLLTPGRATASKLLAAHTLSLAAQFTAAVTIALAVCLAAGLGAHLFAAQKGPGPALSGSEWEKRKSGWKVAASLALFIVLAIVETWPLARDPAHLSRNDNGDTMLNEWTIAWVVHQGVRAPLHLFDANIFYPEHDTLAYSEEMIVQSVFAAPVLWLGGSAVLAFNLVLLAGFALSGWSMCLVMVHWTRDWAAGLISGILFAFNAHNFTRLPHLQAQHVEFLPVTLLAFDALLRRPGFRRAAVLAGSFTLQALASIYLLVFTATALMAAFVVRPEDWFGRRFIPSARSIAVAAVAAGIILLPFLLPYWRVNHEQGMSRSLGDAAVYAASWGDYLSTPGRFHYYWWSARWFVGSALFPGALGLLLTGVAVARGVAFTDPRPRMALAFGVCGVALSFGAKLPGYETLYHLVTPLHAIRAVSRFGYLGIVAVALVAGFGAVEVRRTIAPRAWPIVAVVMIAIAAFEPLAAPLELRRFEGIPPIYDALRSERDAVVVEIPFYGRSAAFVNARYMLNSTRHWRPMVNGYSGFLPLSYYRNAEVLAHFPDRTSVDALQALGVTHVFVHTDAQPGVASILDSMPDFQRLFTDGSIVLYRVASASGGSRGPTGQVDPSDQAASAKAFAERGRKIAEPFGQGRSMSSARNAPGRAERTAPRPGCKKTTMNPGLVRGRVVADHLPATVCPRGQLP